MNRILIDIEEIGKTLSKSDPLEKIYTHSLIEFRKIEGLLKNGIPYMGAYLIEERYKSTIDRYLELLKKIRSHYFEIADDKPLPDCLRAPIIVSEDIEKIKKEVRFPFRAKNGEDIEDKEKTIIHITSTNCKAKHIEVDGRLILIIASKENIEGLAK